MSEVFKPWLMQHAGLVVPALIVVIVATDLGILAAIGVSVSKEIRAWKDRKR